MPGVVVDGDRSEVVDVVDGGTSTWPGGADDAVHDELAGVGAFIRRSRSRMFSCEAVGQTVSFFVSSQVKSSSRFQRRWRPIL